MKRIVSHGLMPTVCDHCFLASPVNSLNYPALPLNCNSSCCKAHPLPCFFPPPLPEEGGCSSSLGLSLLKQRVLPWIPYPMSSAEGWSSGCRVWYSALCSAVRQSLGQTWCQDEDHKHLPHVPQSCIQHCSLQSFMGFSPTPSLPLPQHIFLCTETKKCLKILPFVFRQTGLGRAPCQVWAQGRFWAPDSTQLFQLLGTARGWELCPGCHRDGPGEKPPLLLGQHMCGHGKGYGPQQHCRIMFGVLGEREVESLPPVQSTLTARVPGHCPHFLQGHVVQGWEKLTRILQQC